MRNSKSAETRHRLSAYCWPNESMSPPLRSIFSILSANGKHKSITWNTNSNSQTTQQCWALTIYISTETSNVTLTRLVYLHERCLISQFADRRNRSSYSVKRGDLQPFENQRDQDRARTMLEAGSRRQYVQVIVKLMWDLCPGRGFGEAALRGRKCCGNVCSLLLVPWSPPTDVIRGVFCPSYYWLDFGGLRSRSPELQRDFIKLVSFCNLRHRLKTTYSETAKVKGQGQTNFLELSHEGISLA